MDIERHRSEDLGTAISLFLRTLVCLIPFRAEWHECAGLIGAVHGAMSLQPLGRMVKPQERCSCAGEHWRMGRVKGHLGQILPALCLYMSLMYSVQVS